MRKLYWTNVENWKKGTDCPIYERSATKTPMHKKGSKTGVGNYRLISLTLVVGKLMESLIFDYPADHRWKTSYTVMANMDLFQEDLA
jgi:hypothetical protein